MDGDIIDESDEFVSVLFEVCLWRFADGSVYLEEDYRVGGEKWRVHLNDADPFPSKPHAHCIDGKNKGMKLHLGTAQLFTSNNRPTKYYLQEHQFVRLIAAVQKKFPAVQFPLEA